MAEEIKDIDLEEETPAEAEATAEESSDKKGCKKECKKDAEKRLKEEIEVLKTKLADSEKKIEAFTADAQDKYARLVAEYENFRRRSKTELAAAYADAVADTVMGIVPIIDNLMYAEKFGGGADNPEKFAEGVKLILGKLPETLEKMNVSVFGAAGDTFDPQLHNAVMHVEDENFGEGEIVDVLQCGYKYGDKVIRYAMVKVAN